MQNPAHAHRATSTRHRSSPGTSISHTPRAPAGVTITRRERRSVQRRSTAMRTDVDTLSVSELRAYLKDAGADTSGCFEKVSERAARAARGGVRSSSRGATMFWPVSRGGAKNSPRQLWSGGCRSVACGHDHHPLVPWHPAWIRSCDVSRGVDEMSRGTTRRFLLQLTLVSPRVGPRDADVLECRGI